MKVIIFGATGYVGKRLAAKLLQDGHTIYCLSRNPKKLDHLEALGDLSCFTGDLFDPSSLNSLPIDIDIAYYLVHSLSEENFEEKEKIAGENFLHYIETTNAKQLIFVSGIINDKVLSAHLRSRKKIEELLQGSTIPCTILRAGIIIGSESASFIILRDLTEKLPFMVAPRWIENRLKPISIYDTIFYLTAVAGKEETFHKIYDISSDDELSYKELLFLYAKVRNLRRVILTIPLLTPRLSSYWLIFITSQDFNLAKSLVDSLKNNFLPNNEEIKRIFPHPLLSCREAIEKTIAPLDKEAEYFFVETGKIPSNTYSYWIEKKKPSIERWQKIYNEKESVIWFRSGFLGEYWVKEGRDKTKISFRPKGSLGRLIWMILYPIRKPFLTAFL